MTTTAMPAPAPGTGHQDQAFLVGEHVYLRAIEPEDAKHPQALAQDILPRSTAWYEKWIREKLPEQERSATYAILRKADDVPVGTIRTWRYDPATYLRARVDPLHGERGEAWKAEALRLVVPWLVDEQHRPRLGISVPASEEAAMDALARVGARTVVRFREAIRTWGGRSDLVHYEYLNPRWVERLGDPAHVPLERSGTGEPRPVPARVELAGDPPRNAVRVGERVYLRPLAKDDASLAARWSRQETDTTWDAGRWIRSAPGFEAWTEGDQEKHPAKSVRFAVCLRETDGLIGTVGVSDIDYLHGFGETESEIFRPEYRGGGYGSEAKHLLFDYAFNTLGLHALQSFVIFPNTRSAAALRKQGYREAGRIHWAFPSFGTFQNMVCFDLLAADWRAMPRTAGADLHEEGAR